jgi:hypothetical protein
LGVSMPTYNIIDKLQLPKCPFSKWCNQYLYCMLMACFSMNVGNFNLQSVAQHCHCPMRKLRGFTNCLLSYHLTSQKVQMNLQCMFKSIDFTCFNISTCLDLFRRRIMNIVFRSSHTCIRYLDLLALSLYQI